MTATRRGGVVTTNNNPPAAEVKTEHPVAMIAQALFHDFPDISGLEETMEEENCLVETGEIVSSNDTVSPQIYTTDASQLVSKYSRKGQWLDVRLLHRLFVSGSRAP